MKIRCDAEVCEHPDGWHFSWGELLAIVVFLAFVIWIASLG